MDQPKSVLLSTMPPKKKQQKPTGFTVFMWEKRKEFERNGEKFPNGLADVQPKCAPLWMVIQFDM